MHFDRADENKDGILTFAELWELLQQLEIELSEKDCRQKFQVGSSKTFKRRHESPLQQIIAHTQGKHRGIDPFLLPVKIKMGEAALNRAGFVQFFNCELLK